MAHKSKILNIREEYDGTISSIPGESGVNQELDYCTDETNDQNIRRKHKVFENDYRNIEQTLAYNKSDDYYIRSIVGWTSTTGSLRLVRPPVGYKQLYENIFPVVVAKDNKPVTSVDVADNEVDEERKAFFQYIQKFYIEGHSYLVLGESGKKAITLNIRIGVKAFSGVPEWGAQLFVCKIRKRDDGSLKNRWDGIDRILDRYRNPTDYDVFGMYAGGPEYEMKFQGRQIRRLCYDHRILVKNESGKELNSRYKETFEWYGRDKKSGFRTEPSYDWRFRRVGFYCSLNSLLVVEEELDKKFVSLLRESTFVICDAMFSVEIMGTKGTKVIRDPVKQLCLGPLIAVISEGLYRIGVMKRVVSSERRNVYFSLRPHDRRPLFLHWLDFESDFNPIGPTVDPYIKIQHRLRVLMKEEEFFDFVIFEDILVDNKGEKGTIACILVEQPNVSEQQQDKFFNVSWHFYRKISTLEYYYYLSTHWLSSSSRRGIFVAPLINPEPLVFPENFTIDWNEYSELTNPIQVRIVNPRRKYYYNWWQTNATNISTDRTFHNSCLFHLSTILELREPTNNAFIRAIKTHRRYIKARAFARQQPNIDVDDLDVYRPYFDRFRQVVSGDTLYDWQVLQGLEEKRYLAFVMYDFPELKNSRNEIIDKWDVYGVIRRHSSGAEKSLFHYLGSVSCGYNYIPNDPEEIFWKRNGSPIQVFDMLKREKGINEYWYPNYQDLRDIANELEDWWEKKETIVARDADLERHLLTLMPYDWSDNKKLRNQTYFGTYRKQMFTNRQGPPWDQTATWDQVIQGIRYS